MRFAYKAKKRNSGNRKRRRIILLATEGKNKTEVNYFRSFANKDYNFVFARGNETDPVRMSKHLIEDYAYHDLDKDLGDLAFCVIDGDLSSEKEKQIYEAEQIIKRIGKVIVSNPCIEVWFLCHYINSTKQYSSNNEVIQRLKVYIPNYTKNMLEIGEILSDKVGIAVKNAKCLEEYNYNDQRELHKCHFQPSSEVYKIIEMITKFMLFYNIKFKIKF